MKICSLLPSGTEILFALGLGEQVMGVTDLCDYPPEVSAKPVVCRSRIDVSIMSSEEVELEMRRILSAGESPYDLDQEWLAAQSPDVVLTQDLCYFCEVDAPTVNRAVTAARLQPEVLVLNPRTVAEVLQSILDVGRACGADDAAQRLVAKLQGQVDAVTAKLKSVERRPRVYSLEGINPLVIGGHWIPELLQMAGGRMEIYQPGCPASRPEWRELLDCAPEILFVDLCSSGIDRHLREVSWLGQQDGWDEIPAVRAGQVYLIDHVFFSRPGPRLIQGLEILAQLTHPERFTGLIPPGVVAKLDPDSYRANGPAGLAESFQPFPAE